MHKVFSNDFYERSCLFLYSFMHVLSTAASFCSLRKLFSSNNFTASFILKIFSLFVKLVKTPNLPPS